MQDFPGGVGTL